MMRSEERVVDFMTTHPPAAANELVLSCVAVCAILQSHLHILCHLICCSKQSSGRECLSCMKNGMGATKPREAIRRRPLTSLKGRPVLAFAKGWEERAVQNGLNGVGRGVG
jgi:hypothetical protein